MKTLKWTYKIVRSVLFTAILAIVGIFLLLYILLAIPPVHDYCRNIAERELTEFLGQPVKIERLTVYPLSEVLCEDIEFEDSYGNPCLKVGRLGAGINIWRLLFRQEIEITFIEMIDFNINVYQPKEDSPLNIDYILEALSPKDKNKPPAKFDLKIHNIVLRRGKVRYAKQWIERKADRESIDFNHINLFDVNADIALPTLKNDDITVDLRRLAFREGSGLTVKEIGGLFKVRPDDVEINDFVVKLPETELRLTDFSIPTKMENGLHGLLAEKVFTIGIDAPKLTPEDIKAFLPLLKYFHSPLRFSTILSGNGERLKIRDFVLASYDGNEIMSADFELFNLLDLKNADFEIENLDFSLEENFLRSILIASNLSPDLQTRFERIRNIAGKVSGGFNLAEKEGSMKTTLMSNFGNLDISLAAKLGEKLIQFQGDILTESFNIGDALGNSAVGLLKNLRVSADGTLNLTAPAASTGNAEIHIDEIGVFNRVINNINAEVSKFNDQMTLNADIDDSDLKGTVEVAMAMAGENSTIDLHANLVDFDTYSSFLTEYDKLWEASGEIDVHARGSNINNLTGSLTLDNVRIKNSDGKEFSLHDADLTIDETEDIKTITMRSEVADIDISGDFILSEFVPVMKEMIYELMPSVMRGHTTDQLFGNADFTVKLKDIEPLIEFLGVPVFPLTDVKITGNIDGPSRSLYLTTKMPYIQQGKDKLIRNTYLSLNLDGVASSFNLLLGTVYPTKKGDLKLDLTVNGQNEDFDILVEFNKGLNTSFHGDLDMLFQIDKDEITELPVAELYLRPTSLYLNEAEWKVGEASVYFTPGELRVRGFSVRHGDQFVSIQGDSGKDGNGLFDVRIADVDLDYVFDTLNIEHVAFGGHATGQVEASRIFSPQPQLYTKFLSVANLSYNGVVIGDGEIYSRFDVPEKRLIINANIAEDARRVATVEGNLWLGKDSLSFAFDTDRVRVGFLKPFVKAFSSDIEGRATGDVVLYGTFKDVNIKGKAYAEDVSVLIDYTNVRYTCSDTVVMEPGHIKMSELKVYDSLGNTAVVNGNIYHDNFHNPVFDFDITNVNNLLCYNTTEKMNPLWYGRLFCSGSGKISGRPGIVEIRADMETERNSSFTFVLSDMQVAAQTQFLTFSDKRGEAARLLLEEQLREPEFLQRFAKKKEDEKSGSDIFSMDIRATVTPDVNMTIVMDPVGGDKITATGEGAMNLEYDSQSDELKIYGRYSLDKGVYNFSLQDLILKDFVIKPGSSISFTGNPYTGNLDIVAAYRVNTNLTDLDQSFASDRELNRTNVPVEALLKVSGVLTAPNIEFDIDLPTVTEETNRKVKSIISTDDMMSRQVLYLVALNRFYSPEYMSNSGGGGEWASVASSTISSQLQNVIGQITDKFTIAPSLRSDKGDFSDIEVDVALSSSLFNNRLLLNGNLGYRDPTNSSTTFVGDFDIEYLLSRNGNFRLKAYNHFNDQNYYLKSALTTQGIGVVWRKEFDSLFPSKPNIKKEPEKEKNGESEK